MKSLKEIINKNKNIALSTVLAGASLFGAYKADAQVINKDKLITTTEQDTTILQPYFLIRDLTNPDLKLEDKTYRIDMNKSNVHPDNENKFVAYSNFETFKDHFAKKEISPTQTSGLSLDDIAFLDVENNTKLYKLGDFDNNSGCIKDCENELENDLVMYLNNVLNKYNAVCTNTTTKELVSLNGIMTPLETLVANEKAEKILEQQFGKTGVAVGLKQTNPGHSYKTSKGTIGYSPSQTKGMILVFSPTMPANNRTINESDFITNGALKDPIVPCDGSDDCNDSKSKKSKDTPYISLGLGSNKEINGKTINGGLGLNIGHVLLGLNAGYGKGNKNSTTTFDGPSHGQYTLSTTIDSLKSFDLRQIGPQIGYRDGALVFMLGLQDNMITQNNSGTVDQKVYDGAGNMREQIIPLTKSTNKYSYWTLNPEVGISLGKKLDVYFGAKVKANDMKVKEYFGGLRYNIGRK